MIKTVYQAATTVNEYGKIGDIIGYFTEEADAAIAAKGKGWYGGEGSITEAHVIVVGEKIYVLKNTEPVVIDRDLQKYKAELKENALKKLTIEERHVLGLK